MAHWCYRNVFFHTSSTVIEVDNQNTVNEEVTVDACLRTSVRLVVQSVHL